jgi:regulator of protease activity HflC (stomatin/prohibitin superfamily)
VLKAYDEYKKAPEVTRRRMYLETMERVLKDGALRCDVGLTRTTGRVFQSLRNA